MKCMVSGSASASQPSIALRPCPPKAVTALVTGSMTGYRSGSSGVRTTVLAWRSTSPAYQPASMMARATTLSW